jgi:predicted dehydrogenase
VWRQAAARGVPVFMEKPFLLAPELDRVNPADRSWAALMVDFNRRFWPGYERIARLIRAGAVGRPLQAALTLQASVLAWSPAGGHRLAEGEGGVLYDLGSHVLDLAAFMFCESPSTLAALRRAPPGTREAVDLRLEFASGLVAECRLAYAKKNRESVWIRGAAGALRLDDPNFLVWGERRAGLGPLTAPCNLAALAWRAVFRSRSMLRYSIARALAQFVTCMQSRTEFHPGFAEAYRVARWLRTAAASLETGQAGPLA